MSVWRLRRLERAIDAERAARIPAERGVMNEAGAHALDLERLPLALEARSTGTDNDLVRDFIAGNDAAFTQLVTKYKDALTNYLNMIVGDYDIAVDLCQETFFRVYRNITRYSNVYQFSTWIYRIATNLAIDEMRFRKRRGTVFYNNVWASMRYQEDGHRVFETLH